MCKYKASMIILKISNLHSSEYNYCIIITCFSLDEPIESSTFVIFYDIFLNKDFNDSKN